MSIYNIPVIIKNKKTNELYGTAKIQIAPETIIVHSKELIKHFTDNLENWFISRYNFQERQLLRQKVICDFQINPLEIDEDIPGILVGLCNNFEKRTDDIIVYPEWSTILCFANIDYRFRNLFIWETQNDE